MSDEKIVVQIDIDLEDLIPGFLDNRKDDVEKLKVASAGNDFETLRSIGHNLKGVGGGYGFDGISEIGASIESAAKMSQIETIDEYIETLSSYLANVEIIYVEE